MNITATILAVALTAGTVDLHDVTGTGVNVLRNYSGRPDKWGIFESPEVVLPTYKRGVYYASPWWPAGGNRGRAFPFGRLSDLRKPGAEFGPKRGKRRTAEGGFFLILELARGDYVALLPVAGNTLYSWFDISPDGDKLLLNLGHWGTDSVSGEDIPFYAWARASNPYEASHNAWRAAATCPRIKRSFRLREDKPYPEPFSYLGWCSWEFYRHSEERKDYPSLSSDSICALIRDYGKLGKPVRWMLIDNGHFNSSTDFSPKQRQWPNGYEPLAEARTDEGVKWIGIWYAFMGGGKHPYRGTESLPAELQQHMTTVGAAGLPKPAAESCRAFYEYLYSFAARDGLDFVKIDFSTRPICHYAGREEVGIDYGRIDVSAKTGVGNPYRAHALMFRALEEVTQEQFGGIIHCNWHNTANLFNLKHGVVGRCSEDYKPGNVKRGRSHHFCSLAAMPWLGQVAWGDHDMFHSSDAKYGRLMAAAKALSGGPIYISDGPKECNMAAVAPLCYQDGRLLRPLAPGAPVYDDVFYAPNHGQALRVMAPLPHPMANLAGSNLEDAEVTVTATFTPAMYRQVSGLIQPYPGEWEMPVEGLVYYNVYAEKGGRFERPLEMPLKGFSDCLLQVSPVENGWAVIGRTDKYLCGAAVAEASTAPTAMKLRLHEGGPFAVYSAEGLPKAEGITFDALGGGIYKADIPVGRSPTEITIHR